MRARKLFIAVLAAGCLAAEKKPAERKEEGPRQKVELTKTQSMDFPAGGVLRLKNSTGDLNIEAWDNPNVEITTIRSTKDELPESERARATAMLEKVTFTIERMGNEVVITTNFPRHQGFPPDLPFSRDRKFDVEYDISVPRSAMLAIDHDVGDVNVNGVTGDIEAKVLQGEIMLHLPEDAKYSIDAKSEYGNVNSDFPGELRRSWISQKALEDAPRPAHTLKLRIGYGDIVLLRIRVPKYPDAAPVRPGGSGL